MGRYRGMDTGEGWIQRRLVAVERRLDELAAARRLVIASDYVQTDIDSLNLPIDFTFYAETQVQIPTGYTHAIVNLFASAGTSFSGTGAGNVGVLPSAGGVDGSPISTGKSGGGAISVSSTLATKIPLGNWSWFSVGLWAYANGDPRIAGSGNVHLSGTVLFVRG